MDNRDAEYAEYAEASTSNQAARHQQAREYRRRLLRSSRTMTAAHEAHEDGATEYDEQRRDAQWAFQTPQGQSSTLPTANPYHTHRPSLDKAHPRHTSTITPALTCPSFAWACILSNKSLCLLLCLSPFHKKKGKSRSAMPPFEESSRALLPLGDSRWRVTRGGRPLPFNQTWAPIQHQEEEGTTTRNMSLSPFSQLFADILAERIARQELLPPPTRGFTGSDDGDFDVDAGADADPHVMEGGEGNAEHDHSEVEDVEDAEEDEEQSFDASAVGLKEISNLASFIVSSYKPGCGVKELRDDDVNQYWQSDGPQPHRLNIHFIKRVEIRALRLYLDYELDESYTPTKIQITAGTGPNLTIPFTTMELNTPKGWIDVPIAGAGGGPDGNSLCCFFVRVIILENHQNGKDTHIRGIKVYALDEGADTVDNNPIDDVVNELEDHRLRMKRMSLGDSDEDLMHLDGQVRKRNANAKKHTPGDGGLSIPDFMREPEIR
ncbi:anaphase-promoting complex, subunit 10-domain-containing protein [Xylaria bambusicola]|uniref:anaphase-promoting complex, subunit 10-domain-containing protein n=1 Tax=Xylaria bambusicola TaxID=326684 RepID=UPI002008078C|nr:anaphase-promoting complex, subunit 10-domain-containing protein [Xylaria bambusicola]KAI0518290.1 anaphase-promoting complex, subunit 10-domain-containing protein [Xylaria bambusicola]